MISTKLTSDRAAHRPGTAATIAMLAFSAACAGQPGPAVIETPASAAAVVASGPVCRAGDGSATASFADARLEDAVRATLGIGPDEALTCARLAQVTRLHAPDAGIADLAGIENLVRLGELHIYGNNSIQDVTPLTFLSELSDLNLARNRIQDVAPLAAVRTLTSLDLYGNPIRDVAPLGELVGLVRLRVGSGERLVNVEALARLSVLSRLELLDNAVGDVRALSSLAQLTRLALHNNPHLSDLAPLATLSNLEVLELGRTAVSDIAPLGSLGRLTTLGLSGTRIQDLGPLIGLLGLTRLDLRDDILVSDVQPLLFHPSFGAGDAVRLEGSGVSCADVAALQAKDVVVFSTCR
jgi:internalin A